MGDAYIYIYIYIYIYAYEAPILSNTIAYGNVMDSLIKIFKIFYTDVEYWYKVFYIDVEYW